MQTYSFCVIWDWNKTQFEFVYFSEMKLMRKLAYNLVKEEGSGNKYLGITSLELNDTPTKK